MTEFVHVTPAVLEPTVSSPRQVAKAVCHVLGGSTPDRIMAPQRGSPRTAYLRAVSFWVWRNLHAEPPSYTATGAAFGRDRRTVVRALFRLNSQGVPRTAQVQYILDRLR